MTEEEPPPLSLQPDFSERTNFEQDSNINSLEQTVVFDQAAADLRQDSLFPYEEVPDFVDQSLCNSNRLIQKAEVILTENKPETSSVSNICDKYQKNSVENVTSEHGIQLNNESTDSKFFQSKIDTDYDQFGDFEEFGDFSSAFEKTSKCDSMLATCSIGNVAENNSENENQSNSLCATFVANYDLNSAENCPSNWAAFEESLTVAQNDDIIDDHWRADFASNAEVTSEMSGETSVIKYKEDEESTKYDKEVLPLLDEVIGDSHLWLSTDPVDNVNIVEEQCNNELVQNLFLDIFGSISKSDAISATYENCFDFWTAIRVVEETNALQMRFTNSLIYSLFLHALAIDPDLAKFRISNLPVYAQHLGGGLVLRPQQKLLVQNSTIESIPTTATVESNPILTASNITTTTTTTTTSATSSAFEVKNMVKNTTTTAAKTEIDSLCVPPAQFDWHNSGLTNPLTSASVSASSAILDFDFLTANETPGITATLQRDLASLGLNCQKMQETAATASQNRSLLDELMKNDNKERSNVLPVSELSVEAKALHDSLPNLDYMRSAVLMFPFRGHQPKINFDDNNNA